MPLIAAAPVSVRFSTLAARVKVTLAWTRSGAGAGQLRDHVGDVVDDVGVVAGPADHRVRPRPPLRHVVAGVAGEDVVGRVAGAVDGARPGQGQVLDLGAERVGQCRLDGVGAAAGELGRHVAGVVDDVGVVAVAAGHRVGAGAAVEPVVGGVAGEDVGERVAGAVDRRRAGQDQVLDVRRQRVGDARPDRVGAGGGRSVTASASGVDDVGVVAEAAADHVVAGAAVEHVGCAVAGEDVAERVAGAVDRGAAGQRQVLDVAPPARS